LIYFFIKSTYTFFDILFYKKYLYMLFPYISSLFFGGLHIGKRQKTVYYNYTEERIRLEEKIKDYERLFEKVV